MLRGTSLFICDDCKTIFMGLDIEWNCLPVSATQQCTKCGGWHTMPGRHLDSPDREFYESLWKREDKRNCCTGAATPLFFCHAFIITII